MKLALNAIQKEILSELLDRHERSSDLTRMVSLTISEERFPEYFDEEQPSRIRTWEESVSSLQSLGWIGIDHGKGAQSHRFARLRLERSRSDEIGSALKRMSAQAYLDKRREIFQNALNIVQMQDEVDFRWMDWLRRELDSMATKKLPSSSRREEFLSDEMELLHAISNLLSLRTRQKDGRPVYKTWRRFALDTTGKSKGLESIQGKLLSTLSELLETEEIEAKIDRTSLLSHFGIQAKEEVILGRGECVIRSPEGSVLIEGAEWQPFFCIPAAVALSAQWDLSKIQRVFTIENEDSFHEWCRISSPDPHTLVFYLAGFPSHSKLELLKKLGRQNNLQFFHWGDIDCGGIEILLFLERALGQQVVPVSMKEHTLSRHKESTHPLSSAELYRLKRIREKVAPIHALSDLIDSMLNTQLKLEQEAIEIEFIIATLRITD
jgi:hypothetical protein